MAYLSNRLPRQSSQYTLDDLSPLPELTSPPRKQTGSRERETPIQGSIFPAKFLSDSSYVPDRFSGPPPPIVRSTVTQQREQVASRPSTKVHNSFSSHRRGGVASSLVSLGSILLPGRSPSHHRQGYSSVWRGIWYREKAIGDELQEILDAQSAALASETRRGPEEASQAASEPDTQYSTAWDNTPNETFYSSRTSRSRMTLSSMAGESSNGAIVPVRQPKTPRSRSLQHARNDLLRSIRALKDLKDEEDAVVTRAITQRKRALSRLRRLMGQQQNIVSEMELLENDPLEPLGRELSSLEEQHKSLTEEITTLEEKLLGLKNRRQQVGVKIQQVRSNREAGLSGYQGALKEVNTEVSSLLFQPPVMPLDEGLLDRKSVAWHASRPSAGGEEFLSLIPERRTPEMAQDWWEAEVVFLEGLKLEVEADREALEHGWVLWKETVQLVTEYEKDLRTQMKAETSPSLDTAKDQLEKLTKTTIELQEKLSLAEDKQWNLLICAIGAELAAFTEAQRSLKSYVEQSGDDEAGLHHSLDEDVPNTTLRPVQGGEVVEEEYEESDNEVPPDFLASAIEEE